LDDLLRRIYEVCGYLLAIVVNRIPEAEHTQLTRETDSDAVMKNPFHTPEMPINSSLFESRMQSLVAGVNQ
jgi:hypothetical protein